MLTIIVLKPMFVSRIASQHVAVSLGKCNLMRLILRRVVCRLMGFSSSAPESSESSNAAAAASKSLGDGKYM